MLNRSDRQTAQIQIEEANLYRQLMANRNVNELLANLGWPNGAHQTYTLVASTNGIEGNLIGRLRTFFTVRFSKYAICTIHEIDAKRILLLVQPKDPYPTPQWRTIVESLSNMVLKQVKGVSRMTLRGECSQPEALRVACRQSIVASSLDSNQVLDLEKETSSKLSSQERDRLIHSIRHLLSYGEVDSAVVLLKNAWKRNRQRSPFTLWELISLSIIAASPICPWELDNMLWEDVLFTRCEPGNELAKQWLIHARAFYNELAVCKGGPSIYQVMKILHAEFPDKLLLSSIGKRLGINPTYISSRFNQVTGRRFVDVITEIRVEKALELLTKDPCLTNGQLSEASGFCSKTYFCEVFKRCIGKTVRQYVKESCALTRG